MHDETKEHQKEPEAEFPTLGARDAIRRYVRLRRAVTRRIGLGALLVSAIAFLVALLG